MRVMQPGLLEARLDTFVRERLSVDWRSGPPYPIPPEVDVERTISVTRERVRINRHSLSSDELRDPATRILFASVPASDFVRERRVDGVVYRDLMGDVMGSMTGVANPPSLTLKSLSPNYAAEWLAANLPRGRVEFCLPSTMAEFESALQDLRPSLLMLSGLNVNTRALLRMALFARRLGVTEVWLGGDAALAPYAIIDDVFDRVVWGPGEAYLHRVLVGDSALEFQHPPVHRMLAEVEWLVLDGKGAPVRIGFDSLHLALRLGCTQDCVYCAEGIKSSRGRASPPARFEDIRQRLDEARERGIDRVYFVDPDFGRLWSTGLEERVVKYLGKQGLRWSILTNVRTLERYGDMMADHGLASVYLGIESLSRSHSRTDNRLKILNRNWQDTENTVAQALRMNARGVLTMGLYIIGNPGESLEDICGGVQRLREVVPLSQISTNQPFPGTAEFARASRAGWIHDYDPDAMRYGHMVWAPDGQAMDPDEIERLYVRAHRQVNDLWRPGGFFDRQRQRAASRPAERSKRGRTSMPPAHDALRDGEPA
jgi:hypothetical protein